MQSISSTSSIQLFEAYVIDLDGTVYLGESLLPTVRETITRLRQLERKIIFLTNDGSITRTNIAHKLTRLGLPTSPDEIINSSFAMVNILKKHKPGACLFVIGEAPLKTELRESGFTLSDDVDEIEAVVVSSDRSFDYRKLRIAFEAIRRGSAFYATNADRTCPLPGGGEEPDALPIIAAIEACTGHPLDVLAGKPSPFMGEAALELADVPAEKCLLLGDNLETDIRMGASVGMRTGLVLTGVSQGIVSGSLVTQPDFIIHRFADLLPE